MKWRNGLFDFIRKLRGDGKGRVRAGEGGKMDGRRREVGEGEEQRKEAGKL